MSPELKDILDAIERFKREMEDERFYRKWEWLFWVITAVIIVGLMTLLNYLTHL